MKIHTILRKFPGTAALLSVLLATLLSTAGVHAVTLYKWVDAEGNISYQDKPPPGGQRYEQKSFSQEGARTANTNQEVARSRARIEHPVTLYMADNCESCELVGVVLDSNMVPYESIKVDNDAAAQKKLVELVGSLRVPALTVGNKILTGVDRLGIERVLREAGYPEVRKGAQ